MNLAQQSGHFQWIPVEAKLQPGELWSEEAWKVAKSVQKLRSAQLYANVKWKNDASWQPIAVRSR